MRIGLVTQAYYPVLGGVTEHVWHLAKELERRGHTVTVVTGNARERDDRGLRVIRIGFQVPVTINGASMQMTWGWKIGRKLQVIEEAEKFDLVHIQAPVDPGLPLAAAKAMRSPKIGTYHTYRDNHLFADTVYRLFRGVFDDAIRKIDVHVAVSRSAADICHRYYPDIPIQIVPNGVDTTRFRPDVKPAVVRAQADEFVVLYVGRMDPRKGAKYLFAALPMLEKGLKHYRVLVVGTGWMKKYYDAHIPLNLRHRVQFTGYVSPEDLPSYYRAADVYCSPATGNESFGIVLLEAMACATPVVASDIDGYRWVVHPGEEGILVPPRSPGHLAEAIIGLAQDEKLRREMGQRGRVRAEEFGWPRIVDQLERIYTEAISGRG